MIGLALAGGGVRGAYQIGVYLALKKCHIKIDGFVGTSIGAFNAAMLAAGREEELYKFWQNVNVGSLLGINDKLLVELNKKKLNYGLIKEGVNSFKQIIYNKGISTSQMKDLLENLNIAEDLYKTKKDFGLVTVRFNNIKPLYLFKDDIPPKLLDEYILASCYLPIFKFEKIIDGNYYLDGGFYDYIPANALLSKGYDKVYAVDLKAVGIRRPYLDKKKVIVIKPSRKLGSILNYDLDKITDNIKLGYYDALKVIKKYDGYKYIFKKRGIWYYNFLIRKVSKSTLKEMQKFFRTTDNKKLIIKALEYLMKQENISYYEVYSPYKVIRMLKGRKKYGVNRFINQL